MNVLVTLNSGLGSNLGPIFALSTNGTGAITPSSANLSQLIVGGVLAIVPADATQIYVTSVGGCSSTIVLDIVFSSTTTTSTTTTTTSTTTTTTTTMAPVYYNVQVSQPFTKNDCVTGYGTEVIYTVAAATHSSLVSQVAADALAQADIAANGQAYANLNGTCVVDPPPTTYYNTLLSQSFTKDDCVEGTPSSVNYIVPANTYSSIISQVDADAQAQADATANGQTYANTFGTCATVYRNAVMTQAFTKNDCVESVGTSVNYTVPYGTYTTEVSQAAANALAQADINANGQTYANANGSCTPLPITIDFSISTDCTALVAPYGRILTSDYTGGTVDYQVNNTLQATESAALTDVFHDTGVISVYDNVANGTWWTAVRDKVHPTNVAAKSIVVNCVATTYYNVEMTQAFTKNDCLSGIGTSVDYTVLASTYTSLISQADANAQAQADIDANGQTYANTNGTCITLNVNWDFTVGGSTLSQFVIYKNSVLTVDVTAAQSGSFEVEQNDIIDVYMYVDCSETANTGDLYVDALFDTSLCPATQTSLLNNIIGSVDMNITGSVYTATTTTSTTTTTTTAAPLYYGITANKYLAPYPAMTCTADATGVILANTVNTATIGEFYRGNDSVQDCVWEVTATGTDISAGGYLIVTIGGAAGYATCVEVLPLAPV